MAHYVHPGEGMQHDDRSWMLRDDDFEGLSFRLTDRGARHARELGLTVRWCRTCAAHTIHKLAEDITCQECQWQQDQAEARLADEAAYEPICWFPRPPIQAPPRRAIIRAKTRLVRPRTPVRMKRLFTGEEML